MKIPSSFDRETLQQFLANAFAVQESRINTHSLSDIMQVQRAVASGKLSLDGAMRRIVEAARSVANAHGVAIALIDGDHLTYRAGSGSSAVRVGWRVAASLTVGAESGTNREILRVENAQTDTRIEADICRQFGASSLLILPIYLNASLAGVLDIQFGEPHAFQDWEVRTYRLMAEQIEAALSHAVQPEPEQNLAAELPPIAEPLEQVPAASEYFIESANASSLPPPDENLPDENYVSPPDFRMLPQNEHSLYARCGAVLADVMDLPVFKQSTWLATVLARGAKSVRRISPRPSSTLAGGELSSAFKRSALLTPLVQRAKNPTWPARWQSLSRTAARELSSAFHRSTLLATKFTRNARNATWPSRWRMSSLAAAKELSSVFGRSLLFVTSLRQRAENLTWPTRWRRSTLAAAGELSLAFRRSLVRVTTRTPRAKTLTWLNPRRRLALETVAIVLAFTAFVAYRGRPAKSLESSTLSNSSAIDQQTHPPKPLPGKGVSAARRLPTPATTASGPASTALKRVRVGRNEVDYIADDVTMRVFANKPAAKRRITPDGRVAQFGDDVTVRYFAPSPPPTRTATR